MFFTYGTKLHLMLMMSRKLQQVIDAIDRSSKERNTDINKILEPIIEEGWAQYKDMDGKATEL